MIFNDIINSDQASNYFSIMMYFLLPLRNLIDLNNIGYNFIIFGNRFELYEIEE